MIIGIDASKISDQQKTGIGVTAYNIILNLQKIDKENTYYLYTNKKLDKSFLKNPNFKEKNIPLPKFWQSLRLPLALIKDKPDVFFEPTYYLPINAPEKSIILIHDIAFKHYPEVYSKKERLLLEKTSRSAINKAKKIIFTTKANAEDFLKFYKIDEKKIIIAPLGCDPIFFKKTDQKNVYDFKYFLFIGRIEMKKNLINIVKSFYKFKKTDQSNQKLLLVGKPGFGYEKIIKTIENNSVFSKDVIIKDYTEREKLPLLYKGATALVFPSFYEGFGLPIIESMACETPVISSKIPNIIEITNNSALLVDPKNVNEISDAMDQILNNQNLKKQLILEGYKTAKKYTWEKTAEIYLKTILNL